MSDDSYETAERTQSGVFIAILGFAALAALGGLIWSYTLENRLEKAQVALTNAQQQNDKLAESLNETNAKLRVTSETLGQSVGLTQRQLEARASEFLKRQQAETARLEKEQQAAQAEAQKQIGAVSGDLTNVKTDVGGVKTDVAATKTELANAESQLKRVTGDLGVTSGLVATNGRELELLKHKGDRNYYDLNLTKGAKPYPISGISIELKKADTKHSKYTLVVESDNKKIEKKDKNLDEPVQFYTGKDKLLYELVINTINKNQVIGYLATPKNAPVPLQP
jgi:type II secretory pathway pseudopilin PulG